MGWGGNYSMWYSVSGTGCYNYFTVARRLMHHIKPKNGKNGTVNMTPQINGPSKLSKGATEVYNVNNILNCADVEWTYEHVQTAFDRVTLMPGDSPRSIKINRMSVKDMIEQWRIDSLIRMNLYDKENLIRGGARPVFDDTKHIYKYLHKKVELLQSHPDAIKEIKDKEIAEILKKDYPIKKGMYVSNGVYDDMAKHIYSVFDSYIVKMARMEKSTIILKLKATVTCGGEERVVTKTIELPN